VEEEEEASEGASEEASEAAEVRLAEVVVIHAEVVSLK